MKSFSKWWSILSLILVNLIPLFGVVFWSWSVASLVFIYWFENLIIGFFNVKKMAKAEGASISLKMIADGPVVSSKGEALFLIPFFIMHYGLFTLVHGIFVMIFFFSTQLVWWGVFSSIISLAFSHWLSYQSNFINNQEYKRVSVGRLFVAPYKRVIVMHLTILIGAFFALQSQNPVPVMVVMVVLKIITDLIAHIWEHRSTNSKP